MKIYAQYFEDSKLYYRKNTILQFGNSWNLIGSIILINPGSAAPITNEINDTDLEYLKRHNDKLISSHWSMFKPDATIIQIEKIFNGCYVRKQRELNGVIQLFNLFNLKNPNLKQALIQVKDIASPHLFSTDIHTKFNNRPVYIGWGWNSIIADIRLENTARNIFENIDFSTNTIYKTRFEDNAFWHPRYLNMNYTKEKEQKLLASFHDSLYLP